MSENRIDKIIREVKATQAIEGLYVNEEEEDIFRKYLNGELTEQQVLAIFSNDQLFCKGILANG